MGMTSGVAEHHRVVIIGAGFGGIGMAIRLPEAGITDLVLLERAEDVGGTWRDNNYPGCRCDVPSHLYSFSFAPNPDWTRSFASQAEIQEYLRRTARDFGVTPLVRFGHRVERAAWSEDDQRWTIETSRGTFSGDVLVSGVGPLSEPIIPDLPGLDRFEGTAFHSAEWDHSHDLTGKRVAVIGTGASAIQLVPAIQPRVGRLTLFQRTPAWVLPRPDRALTRCERAAYRRGPGLQRLARALIYWSRELLVFGFVRKPRLMRWPERLARAHLRLQVKDPALRAKLTPTYAIGCKRVLLSNDYYPSLTRPTVEVVTDGIREVRARSIVDGAGTEHEVDTIVLATGFRVTHHPAFERIVGRGGRSLAERWAGGMYAHKGTTVPGFPNLFLLAGPNTGLGHSSLVFMMECQYAYILDALARMEARGAAAVEVTEDAAAAFNDRLHEKLRGTVWASGCASWYLDKNGRNTTLWPGFTWEFRRQTRRFDVESYALTARRSAAEAIATGAPCC